MKFNHLIYFLKSYVQAPTLESEVKLIVDSLATH